jgi:predicted nucleotidyltransferase
MNSINFLTEDSFLILETLLKKKYYLRELSDELELAPSSVHKIISNLEKQKIVLSEMYKNRKIFSLNYGSPLTRKILSLIYTNKILSSKSFSKLIKLNPKGIYLFGSASTGLIRSDSDIDLAIYFKQKPDLFKISEIRRKLDNEIGKEIQLITLTEQQIQSMKKENTELLNQINNKSTLLWGEYYDN